MGRRPKNVDEYEIEESIVEHEKDPYRRQKKILKHNFKFNEITPLTINQKECFMANENSKNLIMYGVAGSGKTFLASYFALRDLLLGNVRKIIIIRSAVSTRDQGFLPGTLQEKMALYETPYREIFSELCNGRRDVYDLLKKKDFLEFMSTSFIRGVTFDNALIVVDEVQNCTDHEINSILTRIGKNSRVILCGDTRQDDLKMTGKKQQNTGMNILLTVAKSMRSFCAVKFDIEDIVRSGFVKEYLLTRIKLGID